jgi:ABC-type multidrug transport system fused ATPase/permease subunit
MSRFGLRDLVRATRGNRRTIAVGLGLAMAGAALGLAQPLLATRTIDAAGQGRPIAGLMALLVALFAGQAGTEAAGRYRLQRSGEGRVLRLRLGLVGRLVRVLLPVYDRCRLGDLMSRVTTDTTMLRDVVAYDLVDVVTGALVVVGGSAMMISIDPVLFGLVVVTVCAAGLAVLDVLSGIRAVTECAQEGIGELAADLERALGTLRTIRAARAEDREERRIGARAHAVFADRGADRGRDASRPPRHHPRGPRGLPVVRHLRSNAARGHVRDRRHDPAGTGGIAAGRGRDGPPGRGGRRTGRRAAVPGAGRAARPRPARCARRLR